MVQMQLRCIYVKSTLISFLSSDTNIYIIFSVLYYSSLNEIKMQVFPITIEKSSGLSKKVLLRKTDQHDQNIDYRCKDKLYIVLTQRHLIHACDRYYVYHHA